MQSITPVLSLTTVSATRLFSRKFITVGGLVAQTTDWHGNMADQTSTNHFAYLDIKGLFFF